MSAGAFINIGVVFALTVATNMAVRKPKTWGDAHRYVFASGNILPIIISYHHTVHFNGRKSFGCQLLLPHSWLQHSISPCRSPFVLLLLLMACGAIQRNQNGMKISFLLRDLFSTYIYRIRLLGPFGVPFLLSISVLYLSIQSFLRIRKTRLHLLRSRPECQTSPTNNPRTCSQRPTAWRKKSRVSLRDVAKMPITLALTISKKSSLASMRVWKGMGMRKCAAASAVDGVGMSMNVVASKEIRPQGHRSLQITRSVTQSLPPTALPLALLRSDDGSLESLPSASDIIIRSVGFGDKGERNTHDITVESRRSLSSKFSLRDRESASDVRKSNSSAFARDESPPPEMKSCSDSKSTSTKDRVPNDGEPHVTGSPASQMFRISLVDEDEEAEVDVHRGPAGSKRDARSSILHTIELVAGESVSVDERQTDDEEKVDLKFVVDAEAALAGVEDTKDDFMEKLSTPSVTKKRPTSMIFTLDGRFHDFSSCVYSHYFSFFAAM